MDAATGHNTLSMDDQSDGMLTRCHPALQQLVTRQLLKDRFQIAEVLDMGGFATVFKCIDTKGSIQVVAKVVVDLETDDLGVLTKHQQNTYKASMKHEHNIYKSIKAGAQSRPAGIPATYCSGVVKVFDHQNPKKCYFLSFLVMQLLGAPVGCLSIGVQAYKLNKSLLVNHGLCMLKSLQCLHERGLVHRDVKPDNFCMPCGYDINDPQPADVVYLLDMGMAMEWQHKGFSWSEQTYTFWGTVDYASCRSLAGYHPTPRDDLEGLACALLEMATGDVPFDLLHESEDGKPLQQDRLRRMAEQKEMQWAAKLSKVNTPAFIKRWMRQLRSLPAQHTLTAADYDTFTNILLGAQPHNDTASSAWSSAACLKQDTADDGRKRQAPEPSRASNMQSCLSDTATAVQSKRFRHQEEEEEEEHSMACGVTLMASPEEE